MSSCRDTTTYQLELLLENGTNNTFEVTVYPKSEYILIEGSFYDNCNFGGEYAPLEFEIDAGDDYVLYYSDELDWAPHALASEIFDSIVITLQDSAKRILFSADTSTGYSENLFDTLSNWTYELQEFDLPTSFERNPVVSHNYTFPVTSDKIR